MATQQQRVVEAVLEQCPASGASLFVAGDNPETTSSAVQSVALMPVQCLCEVFQATQLAAVPLLRARPGGSAEMLCSTSHAWRPGPRPSLEGREKGLCSYCLLAASWSAFLGHC